MSQQSYLIDTNILIGLEDNHQVKPAYAEFSRLAAKHNVSVFVHEASRDEVTRDKDAVRRQVSLSKIKKFQILARRRGLKEVDLESEFGKLRKPNDVVDATLLHALMIGAVDFLVTQDKGLHERARLHSSEIARRVLFAADATQLLVQTYEPKQVPIRHVANVEAHTIDHEEEFFDSLRDGYPEFNEWWQEKCIGERRPCWVVYDDDVLAGLIVRKDETPADTDAISDAKRILKICTFKVRPEKRGVKLGELLLKQVLWFAQTNNYDLAYLTAYEDQEALISLLEFYGFRKTGTKGATESVFERTFSSEPLAKFPKQSTFDTSRKNYPRFLVNDRVRGFGVPILEQWHDTLYPDLWRPRQPDLFTAAPHVEVPTRPGNTIRKVYLCRAKSNLADPGSVLFFYKSKSVDPPSQSMTAVGILEEVSWANSTKQLMLMAGGRSVYSEEQLEEWSASQERPVKVINFLLIGYIEPSIGLSELRDLGVVKGHPQQTIYELKGDTFRLLLDRSNLGFPV
jgi:ribosomal protein S18 acetylase RimI-like enzyme